ncbi:MAG TPA: fibronectin type III domain-containing protein [Solirubrobacterales bacterium]|nr:fibronectin type III domain-containing protein [Solirubrobacterales bacterium]
MTAVAAVSAAEPSSNHPDKAEVRKHKKAQHRKHKKAKHRKKKNSRPAKHQKAQAAGRHRSHTAAPKPHGPVELAPGVTESPNGWIHYTPDPAGPSVRFEETVRYHGTPIHGGTGCSIETPSSAVMPADGRELIREEIAINPKTCEAVYLERLIGKAPLPGDGIGLRPTGVQSRSLPPDQEIVRYRDGHNMQMWVDPVGITITGLSIDLHWPLYGAKKGTWTAKPYSYKFALDGWRAGKTQVDKPLPSVIKEKEYKDEKMWGTAQQGAPSGGKRATAHRRFENIDFYNAVKAAKLGWACPEGNNDVDEDGETDWTVFVHEVQVAGFHNSRMGTWQKNEKWGPCSWMVVNKERVAFGLKRGSFPKEHDMLLNHLLPLHAFSTPSDDEVVVNESTVPVPYDLLPTEINPTSVKLEGGVNPRGISTNWWAQCGPTEAYGMWASGQVNVGSGTSSVPVSVTVPNLQPNTTYHCRMVTLNMQGEAAFSADEEFTTASNLPGVAAAYTTDITETTAVILGWLNPNGAATNFYFRWGKTTAYGNNAPAAPGWSAGSGTEPFLAGYSLTGLEAGQTYHYRLVVSNSAGTVEGPDQTFTTPQVPPDTTTTPATEVGLTSARLNTWINPRGQAAYYYFEYGKTADYGTIMPASPGWSAGSGTSPVEFGQLASGLEPGTTYHYRVRAVGGGGTAFGADQTFTTLGPGLEIQPPGEVTQSKITMASKVDPRGYATTYYFEYGSSDSYGSKTAEKSLPAGSGFQAVSAALEGLSVGWTVHYRIVAKSSQGTHTGPDQVATTAWVNEPSTGPASSTLDGLEDVSCPAAGNCIAVGYYLNSESGRMWPSAERWSGTSWTAAVPPAPSWGDGILSAVSCASATNCLAVGRVEENWQPERPLIMKWNGSAWSDVSAGLQEPAESDYHLNDVDCPAANSCEAVGYSSPANGVGVDKTLALHWDGTAWTVRQSANPYTPGGEPSLEDNSLESVSCASATFCKAVGTHVASPGGATLSNKPLIERLSGSEWVSESADIVAHTNPETNFWLEGISCPTTSVCLAVGHYGLNDIAGERWAFTQRWTGSMWIEERVYSETNQATKLYDVSCGSATSCRAVGLDGRALHWSGGGWRLQAPKPPADLGLNQSPSVRGVSCPTSTECHVVGAYASSSGIQRLTQAWSGAGAVPGAKSTGPIAIGATTATLRGSVNPAGVDASYYFEYGLTASYGSKTPESPAGSYNGGTNTAAWMAVDAPLTGLQAPEYHYRLVVTNGTSTVYGADVAFQTKSPIYQMPVTEAFNGGTTPVSDFATKWAPLQWTSTRKGKNNANGYGPADTAANGAYFMAPVTDTGKSSVEPGPGTAAQATIATGPGVGGRVSLWLDMSAPATAKTGYEMAMQETAANIYTVSLKRWDNGVETLLGSKAGYSFPAGGRIALVDSGYTISALGDTGSGLLTIVSKNDLAFMGGNAGVEITGSTATRVTNFKVGLLTQKVTSFDAAAKAMLVTDTFASSTTPVALTAPWVALPWATAAVKTGKAYPTSGWMPNEMESATAGAYWQKAMMSDTGSGDAVIATHNLASAAGTNYYFALWLNALNAGSAKSGYQLRVAQTATNTVELKIIKWVNGTATTLATKTGLVFSGGLLGVKFALVDKGGTVSAWTAPKEGTLTQTISASDTTYSYGYGGVEGLGHPLLRDFTLGPMPLF